MNYFDDDGDPIEDAAISDVDSSEPDDLDSRLCALPANDLGNAQRLMARNPGEIYWTPEWGPCVWDGHRFRFDKGGAEAEIGRRAQMTASRMHSHERRAFAGQRRPGESSEAFRKRVRHFATWCLQSGNSHRTSGMLKQAERTLTRPLRDFDADPDRLVVANGTLYLPRDGQEVQFEAPHDRAHLCTKLAGARYDPLARAQLFEAFLEKVMPDADDRAFLARVIGYCLTGRQMEQAFFIFHGKGGDGKSTFLEAVAAALGDYVANADIETFLRRDRKGSEHSSDVARLASGVRLVKASEPDFDAQLAVGLLKKITGGEPFPCRAMFRQPFEFVPPWKLIISCNRKPKIKSGDRGIWRRTMVLEWPVSIAKEEMDKSLLDKLRAEASGILNWAIAGWGDWLERGDLAPSPNVIRATNEYRLVSDPCATWFEECCELATEARESADRLYKSYRGWATADGFTVMGQNAFGRWLSERGLQRKKSSGIYWIGVRLNEVGERAWHEDDQGAPRADGE